MAYEPLEPIHLPPLEVAPDTFLIRSAQPSCCAPLSVFINSLVIRAAEPVIVDTGTRANRAGWLDDVFGLLDPEEVRWVVISHDDDDHTGNLAQVLERCPNATVVTTWASTERLGGAIDLPLERLRWVHDGESLDVGDRTLRAIQPPVYDSPATRGVFDPTTGVYWASDCFATPVPSEPVEHASQLPPPMWAEGTALFHHHALAPWLASVDPDRFAVTVGRIAELEPRVIVAAHSPVISGDAVATALAQIASLPASVPPAHPQQAALDAALAGRAEPAAAPSLA